MKFFKKIKSAITFRLCSVFLVVFLVAGLTFGSLPKQAEAQTPFGGMITSVFWCPCSANLKVTVGPPVGGIYIYQPGATILYMFAQIWRPGAWVLGLAASAGAPCMVPVPHGCAPNGWGLPITIVGTSM